MLREYELTIISRGDLSEADTGELLTKYENLITKDGGEIIKKDAWGVRKMAFPMKKHFRGHYVNYDYAGKPEHLAEAERLMRIDENVLRYMAIKLDDKIDVDKRKADLAKAETEDPRKRERERERDNH